MKKSTVLFFMVAVIASYTMGLIAASPNESRKVYASQCGAALNSDVYKGGGTDDTTVLQAVLDRTPQLERLHLVLDGAALISKPLRIHSNTTIECPDKSCGLFLADGSNSSVLRNADFDMKTIRDRNISILGGVYNNNSPGQVHHREGEPEEGMISNWVFAMEFHGVENFLMRDVTIANQRTFALLMANWKHVVMENIHIDRRERADYQNQDGLHFWGPGRFLTLKNIRGNSGDDFIALAPDEHDAKSSIEDVLIQGVHFEEADQGIRMLVYGEGKLDRVIIRDVTGTYRSYGFIINPWVEEHRKTKGGHYGNIVFDTIDLRPMKENYHYCIPFLFKLGGNIESITFKNIYQHTPEFNHQMFILGGGYTGDQPENADQPTHINRVIVDGLYIDERCEQGIPDSYFLVRSKVDLLSIKDVIVRRRNVGDSKRSSLVKVDGGTLGELRLIDISADCLETIAEMLPERGISAHRGENGIFPENTIAGFQEAVRLGASQIEFDVRRTKDGRLVIMHDPTVDRTTNGTGRVNELTFEEIRTLDAGIKKGDRFSGTKIPTFEEALDCLPRNIWVNVHTAASNPEEIARLIVEKNRQHQAFMACGRQAAVAVRKEYPQILICNMERQVEDVSQYIRETIEWKCNFLQLTELGTPEEMKALKDAGVRINFFPAQNPKHFRELVEAGVDFPLVDNMGAFVETAKELFDGSTH